MELANTLCRTCLHKLAEDTLDPTKHDIFLTPDLAKKLILCTSLNVEPQDGCPKHLCDSCHAKVNEFHQFQTMCVESAQRFRESLHQDFECVESKFDDDEKLVFDLDAQAKVEITVELFHAEEESVTFNERSADEVRDADASLCTETTSNCRRRGRPVKPKAALKASKAKQQAAPAIEKLPDKRKRCNVILDKDTLEVEPNDDCERDFSDEDLSVLEAEHESETTKPRRKIVRKTKANVKKNNSSIIRNKRECRRSNVFRNASTSPNNNDNNIKDPTKHSSVFQCDLCPTRFFAEHRLTAHKRSSHDGLVPYPCPRDDCDRTFNRWHCLSEHLKQHEGTNRWYACTEPNCDKVYKHKPTLTMHLRKFHKRGPELKSHICEICGKVFKASAILNDHRYTHKDKSELPYACEQAPDCLRRFSNKEKLKVHMLRHAGIKNYVCPYCGMRKTTRNELKIHINYHTLERTWPCRFCAHVCNSAGNLKMHVRTVHERAKDYACRYCERSFAKPDTRKYHEMTHTGEKPNECKECGKRFTQPAALRTHRKIHQRHRLQTVTTVTTAGSANAAAVTAEVGSASPPPPPLSMLCGEPPTQQLAPSSIVLQQQVADDESHLQHLLLAASSV